MSVLRRCFPLWPAVFAFAWPVTAADRPCDPEPTTMTMSYGDRITNCAIDPIGDIDVFRFTGQAGEVVSIQVTSAHNDEPAFDLFSPGGSTVLSAGTYYNIARGAGALPASGVYEIRVHHLAHAGLIPQYDIFLQREVPPAPITTIGFNDNLRGVIAHPAEVDFYQFFGVAGDYVTVQITADCNCGPSIELLDPDFKQIASNGTYYNIARYEARLQKTGTYTIRAHHLSYAGTISGYSMLLQCIGQCTVASPTPAQCTYTLLPPAQIFGSASGEANIGVLTQNGCFWQAESRSSFVSIKSGQNGWGPGTVTVTVGGNTSPTTRNGTLNVAGQTATITQAGTTPLLVVTPNLLTFSYRDGAPPPGEQILSIYTSVSGQDFTVSTGNSPWLIVTPDQGKAPASVTVSVRTDGLVAGTYDGRITVNAPAASPASRTIAVKLIVDSAGPPRLSVDNDSLAYSFALRSGARAQRLSIANLGGGSLDFTATASTQSGGPWLVTAPDSGSATPTQPGALTVLVDPSSLAVGTYTGRVSVLAGEQRKDIPVTITVSAVQQTILLSQTGLTFTAVKGGGAPPPQSFGVLNLGEDLMDWNASATVLTGADGWLKVTPESGTTDGYGLDVPLDAVSVDASKLEAGQYAGLIKIDAPAADNTPQYVSVLLNVLPAGSDPGPVVRPTGVIFTEASGGPPAAGQKIRIATVSAYKRSFTTGLLTSDGGGWLSVTPAAGAIEPNKPLDVTVKVSNAGLTPGVRRGVLTLLFQDGAVQTVNVLYVVAGAGGGKAGAQMRAAEACIPAKLLPLVTSLGSSFTVPAGWPASLEVRVVDDCGNPLVGGTVTATFSNGDPPLPLVSLKDGRWMKTWQVRNTNVPQLTVKLAADDSDRQLSGGVELSGTVQAADPTPVLGANGVVNAASLQPAAPVAPGSVVSIMGQNLAFGKAESPGMPLETQLAGSLVTIGGKVAPLMVAAEGQINALVPFGLSVNTRQQLIIRRGGSYSLPEPVALAAVQPAVFTKDSSGKGQGLVYKADGKLAEAGAAAKAGDTVSLYCTGLGATTPAVDAGSPAPGSPEAGVNAEVKVTIGGIDAKVESATLAAGKTGIYVVKATVPEGVTPAGDVPVVVTVSGQASPAVTMAIE